VPVPWHPDRRTTSWLLVAYSLLLAVALLAPTSDDQSAMAAAFGRVLDALGAPAWVVAQGRVEFLCNALIVGPVTFLGRLLWPRTRWTHWTSWAFVASTAVECVQAALLSARTPDPSDVVANTLGALAGTLLAAVVVVVGRRVAARRQQRDERQEQPVC
jgi:hypothetical protein